MTNTVRFLKDIAKSHPAIYRFVFAVFAPVFVYPGRNLPSLLKRRGTRVSRVSWFQLLQPFHSYPAKPQRWTHEGIARLSAGKS